MPGGAVSRRATNSGHESLNTVSVLLHAMLHVTCDVVACSSHTTKKKHRALVACKAEVWREGEGELPNSRTPRREKAQNIDAGWAQMGFGGVAAFCV